MSGFADLPEDIVLHIISFLSPLDIIRLRQVSKALHAITYEPLVWIRAYKTAAIPRPPGPYAHAGDKQALEFLERTLVLSAKMEPWTARDFRLPARLKSPRFQVGDRRWHFSWSSWFITTNGASVVYRNLDSDPSQIHDLFHLDNPYTSFGLFTCADTVTLAGHPVTYALVKGNTRGAPLTLLKIIGQSGSSLSLESAISLAFPRYDQIRVITASPRYVCMSGDKLDSEYTAALLDVTTQKIYHLPPFASGIAPEEIDCFKGVNGSFDSCLVHCFLTDTHLLLTFSDYFEVHPFRDNPGFLIQAFSLPSEQDLDGHANNDGLLQMTHEGICAILESPEWVLRNSIVTDLSGTKCTKIRLMNSHWQLTNSEITLHTMDLTLCPSASSSPGTIELTQFTPLFSFEGRSWFADIASSQDGFGRGMCYILDKDDGEACIRTFSVDASGPTCRVVLGPQKSVPLNSAERCDESMQCDLWNGRVCYVPPTGTDIDVFEFV